MSGAESFSAIIKIFLELKEFSLPFFLFLFELIKTFWWLLLVIFLFFIFRSLWLLFIQAKWRAKQKEILLEIKIPKEVLQSIKSMEVAFSGLWQVYDPPNFREKWLEGKILKSLSLEIVGSGGNIRLFIRTPKALQGLVESVIYGQYPNCEISVAEDYTKNIPQNIPNDEWNMWGCDYKAIKDDIYPIRTYTFFEEKPDIKEEKRIDPLALLMEGMSRLKKGEQIWFQIIIQPVTNKENNYRDRGGAIIDKLINRPAKKKPSPIIKEALKIVATGKPTGSGEEGPIITPSKKELTRGEREVVSAIENKIGKHCFETTIRFIYLSEANAYFGPNKLLVMSFLNQFAATNLNALVPNSKTITSRHTLTLFFLDRRRGYLRKRKLFRSYVHQLPTSFPKKTTIVLNVEELASLYHFPSQEIVPIPAVPRAEMKKGGPPSILFS